MRAAAILAMAVFLLAGRCENLPPSAPLLLGPGQAWPGDTLVFRVQAVDPDGDEVDCLVDWGDGDSTCWPGPVMSGIWRAVEHCYTDSGRFAVRARARSGGLESGWSELFACEVAEFGPYVPVRPLKLGRDTVPVGDTVRWMTRAGHPLDKPVAFQPDWGDTVGDWSEPFPAGEWVTLEHVYPSAGTFAARFRAEDRRGHQTDWSAPGTVWVLDSLAHPGVRRGQ